MDIAVSFRRSQETMEICTAECLSVLASSGVAEETDAGVDAFSVVLSAGEGGCRSVSMELSSCVTFSPLPAASGSLQRERDSSMLLFIYAFCYKITGSNTFI